MEPYFWINSVAVLGPTPFTPGMLSLASPIRPITSITLSGGTPNLSITSGFSKRLSFIVSSMWTLGEINCIMSLSPLTIVTAIPACSPIFARVPMMSSAS